MKLSTPTILLALAFLGVEAPEGDESQARSLLDSTLAEYNLETGMFLTEATAFALGYHRGLSSRPFKEDQVPQNAEGKPADGFAVIIEDAFGFGLEARESASPPPPSLVYSAYKSGTLKWGGFGEWAKTVNLSTTKRLQHAITAGSGKNAINIPAGTPVDVLGETTKDGVPAVIVSYDGLALIVPNPDSDPKIVSGDTVVSAAAKKGTAKKRAKKEGDTSGTPKEPVVRGPSLRDAILTVLEGRDGGPGVLQSDVSFAQAVSRKAREMGIGDKATTFLTNADKHVPYYANCYRPNAKTNEPGRLQVANPLAHVVAAIEGRKFYLKATGDQTAKIAAIPAEIRARMEDKEARLTTTAKPEDAATTETKTEVKLDADTTAQPAADPIVESAPAGKGKKNKKA